ncbi:MAG TPA: DUF4062 domain-containing protein [Polyangia bacterium]|jgi:hypothetical protein|nr:DUF4062 domain-containing protein [Polyangia bacterium]
MTQPRKLQVFVSSTFTDLRRERQAAVAAILENGHIPAGMELFAAGDEEQMKVIRRWIDDSDIFFLILGARYGTVEPKSGKSYTQLEYEYAVEKGKPFFAVLMTDPSRETRVRNGEAISALTESSAPDKFTIFRDLVTTRLCKFADDEKDIKLAIWQSIRDLEQRLEHAGWVPLKSLPDDSLVLADVAASAKHAAELETKNQKLTERIALLEQDSKKRQDLGGRTFDELLKAISREKVVLEAANGGKRIEVDLVNALDSCAPYLAQGVANRLQASASEAEVFHGVASPLLVFGITAHMKVPAGVYWQRMGLSEMGQKFLTELRVRLAKGELARRPVGADPQTGAVQPANPSSTNTKRQKARGNAG